MSDRPTSIAEIQEAVLSRERVQVIGGGTKPALRAPEYPVISLRDYAGISQYEPSEYTITARAGTKVADLTDALQEHGQFLPFDPPFLDSGSTIGGMLATGLNGPGAFRFGGLRDFILAVRFLDGRGRDLRGGGKVVKNAAGFDLPKFFVGSLGRFALLTELTFKVFPQPPASLSLRFDCPTPARTQELMATLAAGPWECDAIEYEPLSAAVIVRFRGHEEALQARAERVRSSLKNEAETLTATEAKAYWLARREFTWAGSALFKAPISLGQIARLESAMTSTAHRVYSIAGNLGWFSERPPTPCLAIRGTPKSAPRSDVSDRLKALFDPEGRFPA